MDHIMISSATLQPLIAIAAGVVVLIFPRILNYVVALYFILVGLLAFPGLHGGAAPLLKSAVSILAGILILVKPRLLNYVVAFALIALGVLGLLR